MLGDRIVEDFHRYAQCSASHLAAFVGFEIIRKRNMKHDLYSLFRLPVEDLEIEYEEFKEVFSHVREVIFSYEQAGRIMVSGVLRSKNIDKLIHAGINNVGTFHAQRPLMLDREGNVISRNLKTLYYYRNRLDGYGFEKYI